MNTWLQSIAAGNIREIGKVDRLLLDTDVFSFLFGNKPEAAKFRPYLISARVFLSFATIAESLFGAYKSKWGPQRISDLEKYINCFYSIPSNYDICQNYARIKASQKHQPIDDSDYWIAACASSNNIPLLTNNWKHFKDIEYLEVISP